MNRRYFFPPLSDGHCLWPLSFKRFKRNDCIAIYIFFSFCIPFIFYPLGYVRVLFCIPFIFYQLGYVFFCHYFLYPYYICKGACLSFRLFCFCVLYWTLVIGDSTKHPHLTPIAYYRPKLSVSNIKNIWENCQKSFWYLLSSFNKVDSEFGVISVINFKISLKSCEHQRNLYNKVKPSNIVEMSVPIWKEIKKPISTLLNKMFLVKTRIL